MARYSVDADGRRDYCIHILIYPHSHVVVQFASIADWLDSGHGTLTEEGFSAFAQLGAFDARHLVPHTQSPIAQSSAIYGRNQHCKLSQIKHSNGLMKLQPQVTFERKTHTHFSSRTTKKRWLLVVCRIKGVRDDNSGNQNSGWTIRFFRIVIFSAIPRLTYNSVIHSHSAHSLTPCLG